MLNSITVKELRDLLDTYDDDAKVIFTSDYGDHGHTQQAHRIAGHIEEVMLRESGYSESGYAVDDDRDMEAKFGDDDLDDDKIYLELS